MNKQTKLCYIKCTMLVFFISISLNGQSNTTILPKFNYSFSSASLKEILNHLEKQTGVIINYSDNNIDQDRKLSIQFKNDTWEAAINKLASEFKFQWKYINLQKKSIVIYPSDTSSKHIGTISTSEYADTTITILATVVSDNQKKLSGASVFLNGTYSGITSDDKGKFKIIIPTGSTITISYIGYKTESITYTQTTITNIVLTKLSSDIDEKVIIGYGSTTKRNNTGSITKITSVSISKQPVSNPILALQGNVPGLLISQNSGIPGSTLSVSLRGRNSILNGNDPLYIIDGLPLAAQTLTYSTFSMSPFNSINPTDIESIEILKDADATAIYGSRGANGVILITTKKGKQERSHVDIKIYKGYGRSSRMLKMLNTDQYIKMRREAFTNDGISTIPSRAYDINGTWDTSRYTDWQKAIIGGTAELVDANLCLSGGSRQTQYLVSSNYNKETSILPSEFPNRKISSYISLTQKSPDNKFSGTFSGRYLNQNSLAPISDPTTSITLAPNAPALYDNAGNLNWENETWGNPLARLLPTVSLNTNTFISNASISYEITTGLELKTNFGYTNNSSKQSSITPITAFRPSFSIIPDLRSNIYSTGQEKTWIIEPQINYKKFFRRSALSFLLGSTFQENKIDKLTLTALNFATDELIDNLLAANSLLVSEDYNTQYRYASLFSRINFTHSNKYIFNLTARRDASSRFGPGKRQGNFGSLGIGWIFSEEKPIKNYLSFLSYGKLRASIGTSGNDQLADYEYYSTYSPYPYSYLGTTTLKPDRLTNQNYSWEMVEKVEAAIEIGLFKDKLTASTTHYRHLTKNQLVGLPLPNITGFNSIQANLPAKLRNTGTEIEINAKIISTAKFQWSTSGNISFQKNKLISFPGLSSSSLFTRYEVGKAITIQKKLHSIGVDKQTGIYIFEDTNKDQKITSPEDLQALKYTGPIYYGGIQNSFTFIGCEISFLVQFAEQNSMSYPSGGFNTPGTFNSNQPTIVLNRWQKTGDETNIQKFTQSNSSQAGLARSMYLNQGDGIYVNNTYLRLKNIFIAYELPRQWLLYTHLSSCKIFLQGRNIFTISNYLGLDPETGSMTLPTVKMLTTGIQAKF